MPRQPNIHERERDAHLLTFSVQSGLQERASEEMLQARKLYISHNSTGFIGWLMWSCVAMQNSPTIALGSELNTNIDLKIAQYLSLFHCTLIIFECEY